MLATSSTATATSVTASAAVVVVRSSRRPNHRAAPSRSPRSGFASVRCVGGGLVTQAEIADAARRRGLRIDTQTFGPFFKITARRLPTRAGVSPDERPSEGDVIGVHDGFIAPPPFGILHLDSMRVYNSRVRGDEERASMRSLFGISILLGCTSALMAHEAGCTKMELLAIDDGNEYAAKLVAYYRRLGFEIVRVVGDNGLKDLPDLLVWGGVGTRMNGNLQTLLGKWGAVIRKQAAADDAKM